MVKEKAKNKKLQTLKWILIAIMGLLIFSGFKYLSFNKQINKKRVEMQEQRQAMIDFYKSQGLSEEEIKKKMMKEKGKFNLDERSKSSFFMMRKIMGGSRPGGVKK